MMFKRWVKKNIDKHHPKIVTMNDGSLGLYFPKLPWYVGLVIQIDCWRSRWMK